VPGPTKRETAPHRIATNSISCGSNSIRLKSQTPEMTKYSLLDILAVLAILLIRGGVEQHPGPQAWKTVDSKKTTSKKKNQEQHQVASQRLPPARQALVEAGLAVPTLSREMKYAGTKCASTAARRATTRLSA
jgi:hypothetical protein